MRSGVLTHESQAIRRVFRTRVLTPVDTMRQALDGKEPVGEAEILVAAFEIPDTHVAWGNDERQVIDRGAFRPYLESGPWPEPLFLDHGDAMLYGSHQASKLIGQVIEGKEVDDGLAIRATYDLDDERARAAYSKVIKFPDVVGWSFADDLEMEQRQRADDGLTHLVEMWPFEYSQVGFGAQASAHVVAARTAIKSHKAGTSDEAWDAAANEKAYEAPFNRYYAWRDPDGEADSKAAYKFPHHFADGGAASTKACSSGIGNLNGGRGGAKIPDGDRSGVHAHLAKHLTDADMEAPALRTAGPMRTFSVDELSSEVWRAFASAHQPAGGDIDAWVREVFVDDAEASRGYVIAFYATESTYRQVPWDRDDQGAVRFDEANAVEVEQSWRQVGRSGLIVPPETPAPPAEPVDNSALMDFYASVGD